MSKISIYESKEISFATRGLGVLNEATICYVEERINGMYELYMEYPLLGEKETLLAEERILQVSTPRGNQLFRIYRILKSDTSWFVQVYARHIFYDLMDNFIEDINVTQQGAASAIDHILTHTQFSHPFTCTCDLDTSSAARIVRKNPVEAILGSDDNTFINRWGGEFERDNFVLKVRGRYGQDRGVVIKYGKNLKGLEVDTDLSSVITRIMPEGFNGVFLPEKYIDSPYIASYHSPKIKKMEFTDIKAKEEGRDDPEALPLEEAYKQLRAAAKKQFTEGKVDLPKTTVKANLQELSQTEEYKDYAVLEYIYPFDTVTVRHKPLGMDIQVNMNYYKWDSLEDHYIGIELGSEANDFITSMNKNQADMGFKIDKASNDTLMQAIKEAAELINSGLGGYVVKTRDELLIMDTQDIKTAQSVWRWNLNGLGYSGTGYNGPYELAMTKDGKINASFIALGILDASLIKTGTLSAISINNGNGTFLVDKNGNVTAKNLNILGGYLNFVTSDSEYKFIKIVCGGFENSISPMGNTLKFSGSSGTSTSSIDGYGISTHAENGHSTSIFPTGLHTESIYNSKGDEKILIIPGISVLSASSFLSDLHIVGSLSCTGEKNRVVETENYDMTKLYGYEMSSPMFGDIGQAVIDDEGLCYIFLDDIFSETVNTCCKYQVFLQKEGSGDIWVESKEHNHFVVRGTPGLIFAWEVKIKQRDYEFERLAKFEQSHLEKGIDYEEQAAQMVEEYYKELEGISHEENN